MLGLTFSSKLNWGSYIIVIAKTASNKIRVLIYSVTFLSPEVALYLYKSFIQSCMEYCCHVCDHLLTATWNYCISYKKRYVGLLVLDLLSLLNPWVIPNQITQYSLSFHGDHLRFY